MSRIFLGILAGACLLGGCATPVPVDEVAGPSVTPPAVSASASAARCASANLSVDTNFPAGALASCSIDEDNRITVVIEPEDAPPINCSAWYALRVASEGVQEVELDLTYSECGHRYWPKYSHDGVTWNYFKQSDVRVTGFSGRDRARVSFTTDGRPLFIAAQEIIVPATYDAWLDGLAAHADTTRFLLGKSAEGREIPGLTIAGHAGGQRETVVLVGRQHPPEVTGALAMFPFVETLLGDSELARAYRARFDTVVVPMLNPDGVVRGHWRHGTGGKDLNRDWGIFSQPETRLMGDLLAKIDADPTRKFSLFLDFHSTQEDVVYTLEKGLPTDPAGFTDAWLADYQSRVPGYEVREEPGYSAGRGVSKNWVYDAYGVPTATFELGDETDRQLIRKVSVAAAEAMMKTLLETPSE